MSQKDFDFSDRDLSGFWRKADIHSLSGQQRAVRYSQMRLGGSLTAAMASLMSWHMGKVDVAGAIILVGFLFALVAELLTWLHKPEHAWYVGRAMAESVKTLAWRYSVCADPFPVTMNRAEAQSVLHERVAELGEGVTEFIPLASENPVITPRMDELRARPFVERKHAYLQGRTENQRDLYIKKTEVNRRRSNAWLLMLAVAEVGALVLAALRVFGGWSVDLAGLMAATISAGAAWVALRQYSTLASAYSVAAMELSIQADKLRLVEESDWGVVVADAEEAISREHTMWLASRTGKSSI